MKIAITTKWFDFENDFGYNTFVVPNLTVDQVMKIKDRGIPTLTALINEYDSGYFMESVIDWSICDDDAVVSEEWETPFELFWEQGRWVARRTVKNEEYGYMNRKIASKTEQYDMLMNGGRGNYRATFTLRDGSVVDAENLSAALAA